MSHWAIALTPMEELKRFSGIAVLASVVLVAGVTQIGKQWTAPVQVRADTEPSLNDAIEALIRDDYERGVLILESLVSQHNAVAEYHLAQLYLHGIGVEPDHKKAAALYEEAARNNVMYAQHSIGVMYLRGDGVQQDARKAVYWFKQAALQGDPFAQISLAYRYVNGEGVQQSYEEAVKWFRQAASHDNAQAFYEIGMHYAEGKGVPQDFTEAVAWTRRAAEAAYPSALYNLGVAFAQGEGVPPDLAEAYKWFSLSAIAFSHFDDTDESAVSQVRSAIEYIGAQLSECELERVNSAVSYWLTSHRPRLEEPPSRVIAWGHRF